MHGTSFGWVLRARRYEAASTALPASVDFRKSRFSPSNSWRKAVKICLGVYPLPRCWASLASVSRPQHSPGSSTFARNSCHAALTRYRIRLLCLNVRQCPVLLRTGYDGDRKSRSSPRLAYIAETTRHLNTYFPYLPDHL